MISIYHYDDSKSDKIWAIDMDVNSNGLYSVYFGKRTRKLRHMEIKTNDPMSNVLAKLRDGYGAVPGSIVNGKYEELDIDSSHDSDEQEIKVIPPKEIFDFSKLEAENTVFY